MLKNPRQFNPYRKISKEKYYQANQNARIASGIPLLNMEYFNK
jgi:hypothetical protein